MHTCHHFFNPRNEPCQPVHASFFCSYGMITSAHATFVFPKTSRLLPKLSNLLQSYKHFLRRGMTTTLRGKGACADYLYYIYIFFIYFCLETDLLPSCCVYTFDYSTHHTTHRTPLTVTLGPGVHEVGAEHVWEERDVSDCLTSLRQHTLTLPHPLHRCRPPFLLQGAGSQSTIVVGGLVCTDIRRVS